MEEVEGEGKERGGVRKEVEKEELMKVVVRKRKMGGGESCMEECVDRRLSS